MTDEETANAINPEPPKRRRRINPFGEYLGLRFTKADESGSEMMVEVHETLLNTYGALHGGVAYSLADTGMGAALYPHLSGEEICATIEIKIIYLKPVTSGVVTCQSKVVQKGGKIAFLESEIRNDERLVAKALGTFSIFKQRRED